MEKQKIGGKTAHPQGLSEKDIMDLIAELPYHENPQSIMHILKEEYTISVPLLIYLLRHKHIRPYSMQCLQYIGEFAVEPLLEESIKSDIQEYIATILMGMPETAAPHLILYLRDPHLKEYCKNLLLQMEKRAAPALVNALPSVYSSEAQDILIQIHAKATPALINGLKKMEVRPFCLPLLKKVAPIPLLLKALQEERIAEDIIAILNENPKLDNKKLISLLNDSNIKKNIIKLIFMRGKSIIPLLHDELAKEYKESHQAIIEILGRFTDPSSLDILLSTLHDPLLSEYTKNALCHYNPEILIPSLIKKLHEKEVRDQIIDTIVAFGNKSIHHLIDSLNDEKIQPYSAECLRRVGEPAVEELIILFSDADLKDYALEIVVAIGAPAVQHLIMHLNETDPDLARKALISIGPQGIPELIRNLSGTHKEDVKQIIDDILCREMEHSPDFQQSIHELTRFLQSDVSSDIEAVLINTTADIDHQLVEYLRIPDIQSQIVNIIIKRGRKAPLNLLDLLKDPKVAPLVADLLIEMGRERVADIMNELCTIQNSAQPLAALSAALVLNKLGESVSPQVLVEAFMQSTDPALKERILEALKEISDPSIVENLISCLKTESNPYYRYCILSILCQIGDLRAINPILDVLQVDKDSRVRNAALNTIQEFKDPKSLAKAKTILGMKHLKSDESWVQNIEDLFHVFGEEIIFDTRNTNLSELFRFYDIIFKTKNRRNEQIQYMITCYEGLTQKVPVIIQGGTGLGKTLALITAFLPFLLREYRVIYCTRTIDQLENFMEEFKGVLNDLNDKNACGNISTTLHVGKNTMRERACGLESCDCDYEKVGDFNFKKKEFFMDFKELKKLRTEGLCPYQVVKDVISRKARVVACTYTYLFHERLRRNFLGDYEHREKTLLIVDEAHNFLEDVSEKPRLSFVLHSENLEENLTNESEFIYSLKQMIERTEEEIEKSDMSFYVDDKIVSYLRCLHNAVEQAGEQFFSKIPHGSPLPTQWNKEFIAFMNKKLQDTVSTNIPDSLGFINQNITQNNKNFGPFLIYQAYHIFRTLNELTKKPLEFIVRKKPVKEELNLEIDEEDPKKWEDLELLQIYCIPLKNKVQEIIQDFYSTIFTSATLSPVERVKMIFGLEKALCQRLDSPFKSKNYDCYAVAGFHSGTKEFTEVQNERIDYYEKDIIEVMLRKILQSVKRNIGIFVNSIDVAGEIYPILKKICKEKSIDRNFIVGNDKIFEKVIIRGKKDDFRELVKEYNEIFYESNHKRTNQKKLDKGSEGDNLLMRYKDLYKKGSDKTIVKGEPHTEPVSEEHPEKSFIDENDRNVDNKKEVYKKLGEARFGGGIILLDIVGGKFAEGVNYEGHQMELALIIGLPFKDFGAFKEIYEIKSDYFYMMGGNRILANNLAFRYDAIRKVTQTAGRVHRKMSDRGVIIFMDERLLGLKKSIDNTPSPNKKTGRWEYDYLSVYNLKESWGVLQPQLRQNLKAVVPEKGELTPGNPFGKFSQQIVNHLQSIKGDLTIPDPIGFEEMVHSITKFFEESDSIEHR
ncbi:MAG: helicase C-terminal domain-containing protein [Candidatus Thorarchaeota archaeon]|jgi:Rad3-related DNA helicase/HEAT repeat protein